MITKWEIHFKMNQLIFINQL